MTGQDALVADLGRIKAALERRPGAARAGDGAVDALAAIFGLSAFERDVLLLCAGVELDSEIAEACATANGDGARRFATFGLALAVLDGAHWSALAPGSPLRRWQLVELTDPSVTAGALRVDERILHHLTGVDYLDPRLDGILEAGAVAPLAASQVAVARRAAELLDAADPPARAALCGGDPSARRAVAADAARRLGLGILAVRADALPAEIEPLGRLCAREAALTGSVLVVECRDGEGDPARAAAVERFVDRLPAAVLTSSRDPLPGLDRPGPRVDVARPTHDEQRDLWLDALGERGAALDGGIDALVSQFDLEAGAIARIAAVHDGFDEVWHQCRAAGRPRLDDLAQRIEPAAGWEDLVLPAAQRDTLRQIAAQVRARAVVHHRWGFAASSLFGT